jgi:hypothetical protein
MATRFPKFSQVLSEDPTTRRIWYSIATAHDLEAHDDISEEALYQKIFASHFGHLAIIFLWTAGNLFHVAWQGNFEQWVKDPLNTQPIAHAIWDPQFGKAAVEAETRDREDPPKTPTYAAPVPTNNREAWPKQQANQDQKKYQFLHMPSKSGCYDMNLNDEGLFFNSFSE